MTRIPHPTGLPLGADTLSDSRMERVNFLLGRIHACLTVNLSTLVGYEIPLEQLDDDDDPATMELTNLESGRRYRMTIEEIAE